MGGARRRAALALIGASMLGVTVLAVGVAEGGAGDQAELADLEACGYVTYNLAGTPQDVPGVPSCDPPCQGIGQGPGHIGNTPPRIDFYVCVKGL